uniref:Si:dkey-12j5.1 n=1 Tax=Amphilophus citrinellus TaxID=61819 RepID=A0A3Q0S6Y2_AMPCI
MGGQAKGKKKNKPKRKDNRFVGLSPQERMKVRMHEKAKKKTAEKYSVQQLLQKAQAGAAAQPDEDPELPTEKDVSVAYCSIAEIYLTDLCMEEGAADKCREFIEKALQYHHDNPEALQLMASYLFSTERNQEGKDYLLKSVGMWLPAQKHSNEIPPYESRITTAKLLIESEEYEVKMFAVCCARTLACCWSVYVSWWEGSLAFLCVRPCVCMLCYSGE